MRKRSAAFSIDLVCVRGTRRFPDAVFPACLAGRINGGYPLSVRKARMGDIRAIHALLMTSSADGLLLPRSLTDLYGHLRDFFVVEGDGATVGCGALSIIWENMAEVRSLAVAAHARRKGCGRLIVEACIAEARELDIHRLFALTYQLPFFNALGFSIVEKEVLPQKVWVDCVNCPKFPDCDETAVLLEI